MAINLKGERSLIIEKKQIGTKVKAGVVVVFFIIELIRLNDILLGEGAENRIST